MTPEALIYIIGVVVAVVAACAWLDGASKGKW